MALSFELLLYFLGETKCGFCLSNVTEEKERELVRKVLWYKTGLF